MLQIHLPHNMESRLLDYCQHKQLPIDQVISTALEEYFWDSDLSINQRMAMALLEVSKARKGEIKLSTLDEFLEESKNED